MCIKIKLFDTFLKLSISLPNFDDICNSISTNWADLVLGFSFESLTTWKAKALMTAWVKYRIFLFSKADDALARINLGFIDIKDFSDKLLISQILNLIEFCFQQISFIHSTLNQDALLSLLWICETSCSWPLLLLLWHHSQIVAFIHFIINHYKQDTRIDTHNKKCNKRHRGHEHHSGLRKSFISNAFNSVLIQIS